MFKILPLIISFAVAGSGAVAISAPKYLAPQEPQETLKAQVQTSSNLDVEVSKDATISDSSDLFLSATW